MSIYSPPDPIASVALKKGDSLDDIIEALMLVISQNADAINAKSALWLAPYSVSTGGSYISSTATKPIISLMVEATLTGSTMTLPTTIPSNAKLLFMAGSITLAGNSYPMNYNDGTIQFNGYLASSVLTLKASSGLVGGSLTVVMYYA